MRERVNDDVATNPTMTADAGTAATLDSGAGSSSEHGAAATPSPSGAAADYDGLVAIEARHYVRGAQIARGGMGRIVAARDRRLGRTVAIKELIAPTRSLRRRFEREARITARLQHPSIVNLLEAGVWPDGEPFYAMKLIAGESLDRVVARATTVEARLGLLPTVIAAVDAMAYAHSQRVIHRDLKPHNILVGEFGETVVIDWGLAKDLSRAEPDADRDDASAPGSVDRAETVAGSVIGTPAYMPPEQATGATVDERADVYALGAILYQVLTGAAPYRGRSSDDVLRSVITTPPQPVAQRAPGLPPDLVTIVDKALARDPAGRYPTARELADDLKRFQTGQLVGAHRYSASQRLRRWVRRHRAAVAVGAALAAVLAVTSAVSVRRIIIERDRVAAQRAVAERRKGEAETRRIAAEDLIGFIVLELKARLEPIGKLDLLDGLGDSVIAYYEAVAAVADDADVGPTALAQRAEALCLLGDVERARGNVVGARRLGDACLSLRDRQLEVEPGEVTWRRRRVAARQGLADLSFREGDMAAAHEASQRILSEAQELARSGDRVDARNLALAHDWLASVDLARGDLDAALRGHRHSTAIYAELLARDPADLSVMGDLAAAEVLIGHVLGQQGDLAGALASFEQAIARLDEMVRRGSDELLTTKRLADAHGYAGDVLLGRGDLEAADRAYRVSLTVYGELVAREPDHAEIARGVAIAHSSLATVAERRGRYAEARGELETALALRRQLAAKHPENTVLQRSVLVGIDRLGQFELRRGNLEAATRHLRESAGKAKVMAAADPDNAELQRDVGVGAEQLGDLAMRAGNAAEALVLYREGLAVADTLAARSPNNASLQRDLMGSLVKVGDALLATGDADQALARYDSARAIAHALAALDPGSGTAQGDLAEVELKVGDAATELGDTAAALAAYRASLTAREQAAAQQPDSVLEQALLGKSLHRVGRALGRAPEARPLLEQARSLLAAVRAAGLDDPEVDELAADVARMLAPRR
jgi:tetratricopeptide (TPR) repeat protein